MTRPARTRFVTRIALILLAAAGLYLAGNASVALWDRDEPRYAQASRQMLESGNWVVPRLMDEDRPVKPVFIYWCQATAMRLFGDTAFAARLPSVVAMLLTLALLAVTLYRWIGPARALWTVFIFATSGLVIAAAKMSITDAVLLLFVTIAQLCLFQILRGRGTWAVVAVLGIAVGLAGLTKGPVVLGVMVTTVLALGALNWFDRKRLPRAVARLSLPAALDPRTPPPYSARHSEAASGEPPPDDGRANLPRLLGKWLLAIVLAGAVLAPWLTAIERQRPGYTLRTIQSEIVDRSRKPMEGHKGPPGYYLLTVWGTFFPWSLLLLTGLTVGWRHRRVPAVRFALAATIGPWVMFEVVQTKLPHYLLPVFPFLAFLTADAVVRCARRQHDDLAHPRFVVMTAVWAVVVVGLGLAPWAAGAVFPMSPAVVNVLTVFSALALAYAVVVFRHVRARRVYAAATALGVGMIAVIAVLYAGYFPRADYLRLSPRIAEVLRREGATEPGEVKSFGYKEPSLVFHQGGTLRPDSEDLFLATHPTEQWPTWVVVRDDVWAKLGPAVTDRLEVIESFRGVAYADDPRVIEVIVARKR